MSENTPNRKPDRRVIRTRDRLGDALLELLLAKPFAEITVQEVLDRAGVSRSTFYEHYRDKNDLFVSDADDFFAQVSTLLPRKAERSERVAPVAELFTHVAEAGELYAMLVESGRMLELRDLGEAHFARAIQQRLAGQIRGAALQPEMRAWLAQAFAGALFALLSRWVREGMKTTPAAMDQLFHTLVSRGVAAEGR